MLSHKKCYNDDRDLLAIATILELDCDDVYCSCSTDTVNDSSAHDECHQQNDRRDDDNDDDDDDGTSSQQRTTRPIRAVDTEHDSTTVHK